MSVVLPNPGSEPITPGSTVEIYAAFTDGTSGAEPTGVTCVLRKPDGSETTPAATKASFARWLMTPFVAVDSGRWYFRMDGAGVAPVEGTFVVAESSV